MLITRLFFIKGDHNSAKYPKGATIGEFTLFTSLVKIAGRSQAKIFKLESGRSRQKNTANFLKFPTTNCLQPQNHDTLLQIM